MKGRAAVLVESRRFEIEDQEFDCGPDDILVKCGGSGMCTSEMPLWTDGPKDNTRPTLGHEGWGTVVATGKNINKRFKEGDRVTGLPMACYAEYFKMGEWCAMRVEDHVTDKYLIGEPYYCVNNVVRAAHPEIGDTILQVGLGPMGMWALQALASPNNKATIVVDVDDEKLALAKTFGATHCINPKTDDALALLSDITDGRMADIVIEGSGAKAGMDLAIQSLRHGGGPKLVVMSFFKSGIEMDINKLCGTSANVICAHPGITIDRPDHVRRTEIMINNGVFKSDPLVSHTFELEDINNAFTIFENRSIGYNKGVILFD